MGVGAQQAPTKGFVCLTDVGLGLGMKTLNNKILSNFLTSSFIPWVWGGGLPSPDFFSRRTAVS